MQRDEFVKPSKSMQIGMGSTPARTGWPDLFHSGIVTQVKLNSAYSQIAGLSGLISPAPTSHFLTGHPQMVGEGCKGSPPTPVTRQLDSVGASAKFNKECSLSGKCYSLNRQYLIIFNASITQCMAKAMEHRTFLFLSVSMTNLTPVRRDSYLVMENPGKVMRFHFLFPGLEKSWKLTPGFGKLKGISQNGAVPFFHPDM